jgi:hypothetical protein
MAAKAVQVGFLCIFIGCPPLFQAGVLRESLWLGSRQDHCPSDMHLGDGLLARR